PLVGPQLERRLTHGVRTRRADEGDHPAVVTEVGRAVLLQRGDVDGLGERRVHRHVGAFLRAVAGTSGKHEQRTADRHHTTGTPHGPSIPDEFRTRGRSTRVRPEERNTAMSELLVDFITSLGGYASGEGWPGFWGLEGPEYLAWLGEQPEVTYLMGANTYRLMSGFAAGEVPGGQDELRAEEEASFDELTQASKVVFSSSLDEPLTWANTTLVRDDAVEAVRTMKSNGSGLLSTIGSLSLCRSLLRAG